jgi:hypothetical protein
MHGPISVDDYAAAKKWIREIEQRSIPVSESWLDRYKEAEVRAANAGKSKTEELDPESLARYQLPKSSKMNKLILDRRKQITSYRRHQDGLIRLFRLCADGTIDSATFYQELSNSWSFDLNNRLQGSGWQRTGKDSDFRALSRSFVRILNAPDDDRDNVVVQEINDLESKNIATRGAFLSEMLCLRFPDDYPVLNKPVRRYIKDAGIDAPRGASEGARYLDLAKKMRIALLQNPRHPAKNLAELDTVIWDHHKDEQEDD